MPSPGIELWTLGTTKNFASAQRPQPPEEGLIDSHGPGHVVTQPAQGVTEQRVQPIPGGALCVFMCIYVYLSF